MTDSPKATAEDFSEWFMKECECGETTWSEPYRKRLKKILTLKLESAGAEALGVNLPTAVAAAREEALEEAEKVVRGEIEIYEEQSKRVSPNRLKKIQGRWKKLKDIEKRIRSLSSARKLR